LEKANVTNIILNEIWCVYSKLQDVLAF